MRRGLLFSTLSFLSCLSHLSSTSTTSLHSGFWNCFMLDLFCSNTPLILALFSQVIWIEEFMRPNSHTCQLSLFHSLLVASLSLFLQFSKPSFYSYLYPCYHITSLLLTAVVERYMPTLHTKSRTRVKGKAIPLQTWTGPKGSRRFRLPDFKTIGTWR